MDCAVIFMVHTAASVFAVTTVMVTLAKVRVCEAPFPQFATKLSDWALHFHFVIRCKFFSNHHVTNKTQFDLHCFQAFEEQNPPL